MLRMLSAYLVTGLVFGLLDFLWLRTMAPRLYRPEIGELLASEFRMGPALVFYLIYLVGMQIFAVGPALANGKWMTALVMGALFGFFCYATYDLTNQATMKVWSLKVTLYDIAWGTFATGTASAIAAAVMLRFYPPAS